MPTENPIENEPEPCGACTLCESAGDNQLVYCSGGKMMTIAAPVDASYLAFDPVEGFRWVAVLGPNAAASKQSS